MKSTSSVMKFLLLVFLGAMCLVSCQKVDQTEIDEKYLEEIELWHQERIENLKSEKGFLNIVGLEGLKVGVNSFGASEENDVFFLLADFPEQIGLFTLNNNEVFFEPMIENLKFNEETINQKLKILEKGDMESPYFEYGNYIWNVIKRHSYYGVRIREKHSKKVKEFSGIDRYPVSPEWNILGKFIAYSPNQSINVPNIFGESNLQDSPGYVEFFVQGKKFQLDVLDGGAESFFIIFSDKTSGIETYGGGRYLYVKKPDASGGIKIDFNKAYNPPCVYTPYATCPLTPKQNVLDIEVKAGENSPAK
jgi:uncharacterized protein